MLNRLLTETGAGRLHGFLSLHQCSAGTLSEEDSCLAIVGGASFWLLLAMVELTLVR